MKTIERLAQFIEAEKISLNEFDRIINASNGYIGKQINRKASIGSDVVEKIVSAFPDLNLEWLFTGQGQMLKQDPAPFTDQVNEIHFISDSPKSEVNLYQEIDRLWKEIERLKTASNVPSGTQSSHQ